MPSEQGQPLTGASGVTPAIAITGVSKTFPASRPTLSQVLRLRPCQGFTAINEVNLIIQPGETVGVLGGNGAGKSTLLHLIIGTMRPSSGTVATRGRIAALLELGAGFNPLWTGRRNAEFQCMVQGCPLADLPRLVREIELFADIGRFFDMPMRTCSTGMFMRVAFATAFATDPDILVIDEAMAVGDARFQKKCRERLGAMQARGKTIVLVSHDAMLVAQFCARGIVLQSGNVVHDGNAKDAVAAYHKLLYGDRTGTGRVATKPSAPRLSDRSEIPARNRPDEPGHPRKFFRQPPDPAALRLRSIYNPAESISGSCTGHSVDFVLIDEDGEPCGPSIGSGSRVTLAVQMVALCDVSKPHFGLLIKTSDDVLVYGTSNIMLKEPNVPVQKGDELIVEFTFDVHFASGDYFIDFGLAETAGNQTEVLEWRMSVCNFHVNNPREMFGIVDIHGQFARRD